MINIELHAEQLWQGLALHRFHVHVEEVKRVLTPILEEVYGFGFQRGVADSSNNIFVADPEPVKDAAPQWSSPIGNIEAKIELIHHEPNGSARLCDVTREEVENKDVLETENVY